MQSKQGKTIWRDLSELDGEEGREDCQRGWHEFVQATKEPDDTVLDVGAGLGKSKGRITNCTTQDIAPKLAVDIVRPVSEIESKSYDIVTAFDVIEHVLHDVDFLKDLLGIARKWVFITTPNEIISRAMNGCHVREYTPEEFFDLLPSNMDIELYAGNGIGTIAERYNDYKKFVQHRQPHQAALIWVTT